ncbi:MAG: hypothetical protein FWD01_04575, partial [Defluviitaleaceae bacterium]|nr:hypothetical protein [Defluviitaleaceae bacterium]
FATLVQDGGLGIVVGEPSANAPTFFNSWWGRETRANLPHANLTIESTSARTMRPDTNADQQTLVPDIPVAAHLALEAALEFFEGLE